MSQRFLIVDDDRVFRDCLLRAFEGRGLQALAAATHEEALERLAQGEDIEHAILDMRMAEGSSLPLIPKLLALRPTLSIVVLTGYGSIATALDAMRLGALHYLTKPADLDEILSAFARGEEAETSLDTQELQVPSLARVEWEHIQRVLADCNGNVTQAARLLGMHRRSLQRKLTKYPAPR